MFYLLKLGELCLKGGNRRQFERVLQANLAAMLRGTKAVLNSTDGRFYVTCEDEAAARVEDILNHLAGITGWARANKCEKTESAMLEAVKNEARFCFEKGARSFKIEARRSDKGFPLSSYEICRIAGEAVTADLPDFKVDVHNPPVVINVEIREKCFVYGYTHKGIRGLPPGTAGRGLLLLSGGIDSPVAGFLMALRGMHIDAVYFHAYPYTSHEARAKVVSLAGIIGRYSMGISLYTINFTAVQMRIKEAAPEPWSTVLLRMAMMEAASILARARHCKCLITGESLSQVASQTIENIACTSGKAFCTVLRPLIGMDKEDITKIATGIGTYETSILPYPDCCVLFSPEHPVLRGKVPEANDLYDNLNLTPLIDKAIREKTVEKCGFHTGGLPRNGLPSDGVL
ncbi:putative tRNA sulfurtransferase [Spirochaetia bacterium]|nr:putative tRNA sulfurtransferase [Spirochaetia bacterium]